MHKKFFIPALLLLTAIVFSACGTQPSINPKDTLINHWQLNALSSHDSDEKESVAEDTHIITFVDGERPSFNANIAFMELEAQGSWMIDENKLILVPQPEDFHSEIDSLVYMVDDGTPRIIYYKDGIQVALLLEDRLVGEEKPQTYTIEELDVDYLVLADADKVYYFVPKVEALPFVESFGIVSVVRGLLGLMLLVGIAYIFSANRRAIDWAVVGKGLLIQIILAIGILKVPAVQFVFESISRFFVVILDFSGEGAEFLLGGFMDVSTYGFIFAFQVLPTIIFFSALTSVLFYLGIIQKVVYGLAWLMVKAMKLSGAESLSVAGNIFLGQTESPLLVKAYLPSMNRSEIMLVMIGGMATIAGGVLAAYISFLGGDDPIQRLYFAKHLLAASIMAAPGAIVVSKILMPQTQDISKTITITQDKIGSNLLEAISNGTGEGLKLAANVAAMLLVFVALVAMVNYIMKDFLGNVTGLNPIIENITNGQYDGLSLQFVLGYMFAPLVYSIGVSAQDMAYVGQLLGEKITLSEFIAYISLAELKESAAFASEKSIVMATYMLCGFANFASIGIQIGGIGSLAPNQRTLLSQFGMRALLGGSIASLFSATIVGMLF